jgi:hypothetical protein
MTSFADDFLDKQQPNDSPKTDIGLVILTHMDASLEVPNFSFGFFVIESWK